MVDQVGQIRWGVFYPEQPQYSLSVIICVLFWNWCCVLITVSFASCVLLHVRGFPCAPYLGIWALPCLPFFVLVPPVYKLSLPFCLKCLTHLCFCTFFPSTLSAVCLFYFWTTVFWTTSDSRIKELVLQTWCLWMILYTIRINKRIILSYLLEQNAHQEEQKILNAGYETKSAHMLPKHSSGWRCQVSVNGAKLFITQGN